MKKFTRLDFLKMLALTFASVGLSKIAIACSGTNNNGTANKSNPDCLNAGTQVEISANHGHQLTVSKEDVAAGVSKTYNIKGKADHSHTVTLTASDFASLAENMQIIETSTVSVSHSHGITVLCASV
jgi:hypothetical protein